MMDDVTCVTDDCVRPSSGLWRFDEGCVVRFDHRQQHCSGRLNESEKDKERNTNRPLLPSSRKTSPVAIATKM